MNTKILDKIDQEQKRKEGLPEFRVGDSLRVHVKIKEGDKERIQLYSGTVIARDGEGASETFTVRRVSYGEGIERVFPDQLSQHRQDRGREVRQGPPRQAVLPARPHRQDQQGRRRGSRATEAKA